MADAAAIAREALAALDDRRQIGRFSDRQPAFDIAAAQQVTAELRALREARGEKPLGRKIGFTNRGLWDAYGVYAPIWGFMYDTTVVPVSPGDTVSVSGLSEPLIEPEVVLGLRRGLRAGMGLDEVAEAIDWVAHGFEIVQSIFPGWKITAADCIANGAMHARLAVGPRRHLSDTERATLAGDLSALRVTLLRDGEALDEGSGANVLDGPLQALAHLVDVLAADPFNPSLAAGEIVTTGSMTRAFPIRPGESWATAISGYPLPGLSVSFR